MVHGACCQGSGKQHETVQRRLTFADASRVHSPDKTASGHLWGDRRRLAGELGLLNTIFCSLFYSLILIIYSVAFFRTLKFTTNIYQYKKFKPMLTRRGKAYSSSCSQTVSLSLTISSHKSINTFCFGSSESFKVIDVDTIEKLITSACCDKQHAHAYLQPFSRKTGQQRWNNDFYGGTALWCPRAQVFLNL